MEGKVIEMTVLRDRFLMKRVSLLLALVALWGLSCCLAAAQDAVPTGSATKIWDQAPHNAFTDLVRFNDRWFCVFREGKGHVSPDGALRVITSVDGEPERKTPAAMMLALPKNVLARMLHMRAETLSRVLRKLEEAGGITLSPKLAVKSTERLAEIVESRSGE